MRTIGPRIYVCARAEKWRTAMMRGEGEGVSLPAREVMQTAHRVEDLRGTRIILRT